LRVGALAAALSGSVNALVLAIASSLFGPVVIPPDEAVTLGQVVGASVAGAVGAAAMFAVIGRLIRRPIRIFWGVAAVGLLLSSSP
jgi:putative exporter of polyketide antibiotics